MQLDDWDITVYNDLRWLDYNIFYLTRQYRFGGYML